jgi:WD40 repeat protein
VPGTSHIISIHHLKNFIVWDFEDYFKSSDHLVSRSETFMNADYVSAINIHPSGKKFLINSLTLYEYSLEDGRTRMKNIYGASFTNEAQFIKKDERIVYSTPVAEDKLAFNKKNSVSADTEIVFNAVINCLSVSPDDKSVRVVYGGNRISTVSTDNYAIQKTDSFRSKNGYEIISMVHSYSGSKLVLSCTDSVIRVADPETFKIKKELKGHNGSISTVAFTKDDKWMVSTANEERVLIWDSEKGKIEREFKPCAAETFIASPDAATKTMMTISYDNIIRVFDWQTLKLLSSTDTITSFYKDAEITPDNKYLVAALSNGTIKIFNYPSLTDVYTLVTIANKPEVLAFTNDNYYVGGKYNSKMLAFDKDNKMYPAEQFDILFNRPDLVLSRCEYADTSLLNDYKNAGLKRNKKYQKVLDGLKHTEQFPVLSITNRTAHSAMTYETFVRVAVKASGVGSPLTAFTVLVNHVPVFGTQGQQTARKKNIDTVLTIPLQNGENDIVIKVKDENGLESFPEIMRIKNIVTKVIQRKLFLVCIGVSEYKNSSYNLAYAAKDARDIAAFYKADTFVFKTQSSLVLTDKEVTREKLPEIKKFLSAAGANDVVLFFIAGHGVLDKSLDYFFAPYDLDFNDPSKRGITIPEIEELLGSAKAFNKLLIMDSCHSGEIEKDDVKAIPVPNSDLAGITFRGGLNAVGQSDRNKKASRLLNSMFAEMSSASGATILASTSGADFAMESEQWKNGLFTYCLLNGLTTMEADLNFNNKVQLNELIQYLRSKVSELSGGAQEPNTRYENEYCNFRVW